MIAVPIHCQMPLPPRHWILCTFQQLLSFLLPRVPLLISWDAKVQLEAFFPPLSSNACCCHSMAYQQKLVSFLLLIDLLCPPLLLMPTWNPHESHGWVLMGTKYKVNIPERAMGGHKSLQSYLCSRSILKGQLFCVHTDHGSSWILAAVQRICK